MKIFIFKISLAILLLCVNSSLYADKEWVHQWQVKQAYMLLKNQLGFDIQQIWDKLGYNHSGAGYYPFGNNGIVYSSWEEDTYNPVWEVGGLMLGINSYCGWDASATHLWNSDFGDGSADCKTYCFGHINIATSAIDTLKVKYNTHSVDCNYSDIRNGYFYLTIGLLDILGFGVGYQINKNYSVGIKWSDYWLSDVGGGGLFPFPDNGGGFGIRLSRNLNYKVFNNLNFEVLLFYTVSHRSYKQFIKGASFDINIGDENNINNGFNFIWSVGCVVNGAKGAPPLFMPNFKIGFNINY